jgi:hypothetical protein
MVDVHRVLEERSKYACFFGTPRREPTPPMGLHMIWGGSHQSWTAVSGLNASLVDGHAIWKKQWSISDSRTNDR